MDIERTIIVDFEALRTMVVTCIPNSNGVSSNSSGHTRIHVDSSDASQAEAILANYDGLTVAGGATITYGDADPDISCVDALIASDSQVGYVVLLDGEIYDEGTVAVTSGSVTLTLESPEVGDYDIFIYRLTGNHASGSVRIGVEEAS